MASRRSVLYGFFVDHPTGYSHKRVILATVIDNLFPAETTMAVTPETLLNTFGKHYSGEVDPLPPRTLGGVVVFRKRFRASRGFLKGHSGTYMP